MRRRTKVKPISINPQPVAADEERLRQARELAQRRVREYNRRHRETVPVREPRRSLLVAESRVSNRRNSGNVNSNETHETTDDIVGEGPGDSIIGGAMQDNDSDRQRAPLRHIRSWIKRRTSRRVAPVAGPKQSERQNDVRFAINFTSLPDPEISFLEDAVVPKGLGHLQSLVISRPARFKFARHRGYPVILGEGEYGRVYLVRKGGELYALKAFKTKNNTIQDVFTEAEKTIDANKLGIGPMFGGMLRLADDGCFHGWGLVTEYLGESVTKRGKTVRDLVTSFHLTDDQHRDIMLQVMRQLAWLNKEGFAMRDVNANNIMVTKSSKGLDVYLLDFGMAVRWLDTDTARQCDMPRILEMMEYVAMKADRRELFWEAREQLKTSKSSTRWEDLISAIGRERFFPRFSLNW